MKTSKHSRRFAALVAAATLALAMAPLAMSDTPAGAVTTSFVSAGSSWRYLDTGVDQGTAWRATPFNDGSWKTGNAQIGYGDGDEATVVSFGPSSTSKYRTTYFRKAFSVADASQVTS